MLYITFINSYNMHIHVLAANTNMVYGYLSAYNYFDCRIFYLTAEKITAHAYTSSRGSGIVSDFTYTKKKHVKTAV